MACAPRCCRPRRRWRAHLLLYAAATGAVLTLDVLLSLRDGGATSHSGTGDGGQGFPMYMYHDAGVDQVLFTFRAATTAKPLVPPQQPPDLLQGAAQGDSLVTWLAPNATARLEMAQKARDGVAKQRVALRTTCEHKMTLAPPPRPGGPPYCPCYTPEQVARLAGVSIDLSPPPWAALARRFRAEGVTDGGHRVPVGCSPRQRVLIIIPYRDRARHLHVLLNHLHTMLSRQNIVEYRIVVVEQAHPLHFNKALLMNAAFLELLPPPASGTGGWDCVMFHDVDLLAEEPRHVLGCHADKPLHLAMHVDKENFKKMYSTAFGGVTLFRPGQFKKVNGYNTEYWGWGGEDDDMYKRATIAGLAPIRPPATVCRYSMIKHKRDRLFPENFYKNRFVVKSGAEFREFSATHGLSSTRYVVHARGTRPLYTWLYIEAVTPLSDFHVQEATCSSPPRRNTTSDASTAAGATVAAAYSTDGKTLIECATACQTDARCVQFVHERDALDRPVCVLRNSVCETSPGASGSVVASFVYTKGRTLDAVVTDIRPTLRASDGSL